MSECACVNVDWGMDADFHTSRVQKSRVTRKCDECEDVINPGDEYERVFGVWEGDGLTYRTCMICREIRSVLMCSWTYGSVWEDLLEAFGHQDSIPWSEIGSLSKESRDVFCDWIEEEIWDEEEPPK